MGQLSRASLGSCVRERRNGDERLKSTEMRGQVETMKIYGRIVAEGSAYGYSLKQAPSQFCDQALPAMLNSHSATQL